MRNFSALFVASSVFLAACGGTTPETTPEVETTPDVQVDTLTTPTGITPVVPEPAVTRDERVRAM